MIAMRVTWRILAHSLPTRPARGRAYRGAASPRPPTLSAMAVYAAYGSNMDPQQMAQRAPHSPLRGTGWLDGLAADLRRRGPRLGGRARHRRRGPGSTRSSSSLYDVHRRRRAALDQWEGADLGALPQDPGAGARRSTASVLAWLYVLDDYEGGLPVGALPRASSPTPPRPPAPRTTTSPSCAPGRAPRSARAPGPTRPSDASAVSASTSPSLRSIDVVSLRMTDTFSSPGRQHPCR